MIVEYAGVLAAVSILALAVGGGLDGVRSIPTSSTAALALVSTHARASEVPVAGARSAYRRAPYRKASLKYLYAVGWVGGTRSPSSCAFVSLSQGSARELAEQQIRRKARLVAALRSRGIPPRTAAATLVRGVVSACA